MSNKKRIRKLLQIKYKSPKIYKLPAWHRLEVTENGMDVFVIKASDIEKYGVKTFDKYVLGYDFAIEAEKLGKEGEKAGKRFLEFVESIKEFSARDFQNEYLNTPTPTGWLPPSPSGWPELTQSGWMPVASEIPKKLQAIDKFGFKASIKNNKIKGASPEA